MERFQFFSMLKLKLYVDAYWIHFREHQNQVKLTSLEYIFATADLFETEQLGRVYVCRTFSDLILVYSKTATYCKFEYVPDRF